MLHESEVPFPWQCQMLHKSKAPFPWQCLDAGAVRARSGLRCREQSSAVVPGSLGCLGVCAAAADVCWSLQAPPARHCVSTGSAGSRAASSPASPPPPPRAAPPSPRSPSPWSSLGNAVKMMVCITVGGKLGCVSLCCKILTKTAANSVVARDCYSSS